VESLASLVAKAQSGDHEAFAYLVRRFSGAVLAWTQARLGNKHDAEDAAQEAFVTAYRSLEQLREPASFPAWLRQITRTACDRRLRRSEIDTEPLSEAESCDAESPAHSAQHSELADTVNGAIRALSPGLRDCVRMHYLEGYSVREIASSLGVPAGTVKRRLYDGRSAMREDLRPFAPPTRRPVMTKELEGLRWNSAWTSHMGCIKGCVDWLSAQGRMPAVTRAWIFGGTGHAFIINFSPDACPSGPTAWHTEMLFKNGANLGYDIDGVITWKRKPDFAAKQEAAWTYVRRCIDEDIPVYGWELRVPEYYTVHGYDDVGYYYSGPTLDEGEGPKPWRELGDTEIGLIELYSTRPSEPRPDDEIVRASLAFALKHADDPGDWKYGNYVTGPAAFDAWVNALENGSAGRFGHSYNAEVWHECRAEAVNFLREAKERIGGDGAFDEAIERYSAVRDALSEVQQLDPFPPPEASEATMTSPEAAEHVRQAGAGERKALDSLRAIVAALG